MNKGTRTWLHGLFAALIGGGAGAVTNGIILPALKPNDFNFRGQFLPLLGAMAATFLVSGVLSVFLYLKQSPLPPEPPDPEPPASTPHL